MAPTFYLSFRVIRSLLKQNLWEGITCQLYSLKNILMSSLAKISQEKEGLIKRIFIEFP